MRGFDPFGGREAPGAIANGTRVRKVITDAGGDAHHVGALATVVSSVGPLPEWEVRRAVRPDMQVHISGDQFGYMVTWDDAPDVLVFVSGFKIEAV